MHKDTAILDKHLLVTADNLSNAIGGQGADRIFTAFAFAPGQPMPEDGLVPAGSDIRLILPPPAQAGNITTHPFIVHSQKIQNAFISATGYAPPLTTDFANNTDAIRGTGLLICGADTTLSLPSVDGEKRFVQLYRDNEAIAFPNAFCSPGGVLNTTPITNAVKELNEEIGMVVRQGGKYYALFFNDEGVTGIVREEKEKRMELMFRRMKETYGSAFELRSLSDMTLIDVGLVPDKDLKLPLARMSITADVGGRAVTSTSEGVLLHKKNANSMILQTVKTLPDSVAIPGSDNRLSLSDLEHGRSLFVVDTESPHFKREAFLLTAPEIRYAAQYERAMMDNTTALFSAALADVAPAPNIVHETPDRQFSLELMRNSNFGKKDGGGPWTLASVKGLQPDYRQQLALKS